MSRLVARKLPDFCDVLAPDGSEVRVLLANAHGSMAHFKLRQGHTSKAVAHKTVEELWYVIKGRGAFWRALDGVEVMTPLEPGISLNIPVGTQFQFRCEGDEALEVVAVTTPPWPGPEEAYFVKGKW